MATLFICRSILPFLLFIFPLLTLNPISTVSVVVTQTSKNDVPNFDPQISLIGNAMISDDRSYVQLSSPLGSNSGLVVFKHPLMFHGSKPKKMTSFSTEFAFSFTGNGKGLSLFMGPFNFASNFVGRGQFEVSSANGLLGILFGSSMGSDIDGSNASLVAVNVSNGSSSMSMGTYSGEKIQSWVDYDASSKRLEVRLSKMGDKRPYNPVVAIFIDLSKLWGDSEVYAALGSLNGNSSETCSLYSWRFKLRNVPYSMHSLPVDPHSYVDEPVKDLQVHKRTVCPLTILAGTIFVVGCGSLLAFVVLFAWSIVVNRHTMFPVEDQVKPVGFKYEKISVVVKKNAQVLGTRAL